MGTMIQRHKLTEAEFRGERFRDHRHDLKGNNDLLILTRPDDDRRNSPRLSRGRRRHHRDEHVFLDRDRAVRLRPRVARVYELNVEGARLARAAADEWTAQDAGSAAVRRRRDRADQPDVVDFARRQQPGVSRGDVRRRCAAAYREQVAALVDGGVDLLLLETIFDTLERQGGDRGHPRRVRGDAASELPLMISVTITDRSGRTLSGQTLDAFYISIRHARPFSVGINCALGAREMRPYVAELARIAESYVTCYPNAGLPNAFGEYDEAARRDGSAAARVRRVRRSSTSSAAAAERRRITSGRLRRRSRDLPRARDRADRRIPDFYTSSPGSRPSRSGPTATSS